MNRNIKLVLLLLFISLEINAQDVDFLRNKVKDLKDDTLKLNALSSLAEKDDAPQWMEFNKQAYDLSNKLLLDKDPNVVLRAKKGLIEALNNFGFEADTKDDKIKAIEHWTDAMKLCLEIRDKKRLAIIYNNIGYLYYRNTEFQSALDFYTKSIQLKSELEDYEGVANTNVNIGSVYMQQGELETAKNHYNKALKVFEKKGQQEKIAQTYVNIGNIYIHLNKYDQAATYFNSSLAIYKELNHPFGIANSLTNLGVIELINNKNYTKSLENFDASINSFMAARDSAKINANLSYKARCFAEQGKSKEAYDLSLNTYKSTIDKGFPEDILLVGNNHYLICKKQEKFKEAMEALERCISAQDKLNDVKEKKAALARQL